MLRELKVLEVHRVLKVLKDQEVHKVLKVQQETRDQRVHGVHRVLKEQLELKGRQEIEVLRVILEPHQVLQELQEQPVVRDHKVLKGDQQVHKDNNRQDSKEPKEMQVLKVHQVLLDQQ